MVEPGTLVGGRYRLKAPLASGGMARVWEATDEVLGRPVAVKVLHPHLAADDAFVARFRAEAVNAARLSHPAIVSVYDTWSGDDVEAIVMELVRGTTLRHLLDRRGALAPQDAVAIAVQVAGALDHAHRAGIVHRDVKPANVLLSADGRVLVTDFGIAKATESADLTAEHSMLGTAKYLAPEQVEGGAVDPRTDVYALGVVLHECLAGQPPFVADSETATALARLHRDPEPLRRLRPEISPSLEALVLRCLARDRRDRVPDAVTLRRELLQVDATADGTRLAPDHTGAAPQPTTASAAPVLAPRSATPDRWDDHHPIRVEAHAGAAPVASDAPAGSVPAPGRPRRRRAGPVLVAMLIGLGLAVLAALLVALRPGREGDGEPVAVASARAFDPLGPGDGEHDEQAPLAVDGEPDSAWRTERYSARELLIDKGGVGLVVELDRRSEVEVVEVTSPSPGWSGRVYALNGPAPEDLDGWGEPVDDVTDVEPGDVTFEVGRQATALLVWITDPGPGLQVELAEVVPR